ncbi:MAG: porin family protein [Candidatus Aminicenantales bacterium]
MKLPVKPSGRRALIVFAGLPIMLLIVIIAAPAVGIAGQVQVGAHGGLSIPNIRDGDNEFSRGYTSRKGPFFGLFAEFRLLTNFSLRAEVNYASHGGKRDGRQPVIIDLPGLVFPPELMLYADFDNESILDYLEVPVLAELAWGRKPRFFINAGPYIGLLVRAKTVTSGSSTLYIDDSGTPLLIPPDFQPLPALSFDATTDSKKDINDLSAGVAGGIGLAIPAGPGELILGVRFSLGLTNIQTDVEAYGKNHTGAVVMTLGYAYTLK